MPSVTIPTEAFDDGYLVIVEPWSVGLDVNPADRCRLVVTNLINKPELTCGVLGGSLVITVYTPGSTFAFYRGDQIELNMPVASL